MGIAPGPGSTAMSSTAMWTVSPWEHPPPGLVRQCVAWAAAAFGGGRVAHTPTAAPAGQTDRLAVATVTAAPLGHPHTLLDVFGTSTYTNRFPPTDTTRARWGQPGRHSRPGGGTRGAWPPASQPPSRTWMSSLPDYKPVVCSTRRYTHIHSAHIYIQLFANYSRHEHSGTHTPPHTCTHQQQHLASSTTGTAPTRRTTSHQGCPPLARAAPWPTAPVPIHGR